MHTANSSNGNIGPNDEERTAIVKHPAKQLMLPRNSPSFLYCRYNEVHVIGIWNDAPLVTHMYRKQRTILRSSHWMTIWYRANRFTSCTSTKRSTILHTCGQKLFLRETEGELRIKKRNARKTLEKDTQLSLPAVLSTILGCHGDEIEK